MASVSTKQNVVQALCRHLSLNPNEYTSELGGDFKSLCLRILNSSRNGGVEADNSEMMKWIGATNNILENSSTILENLIELNEQLITRSVVLGNGLKPTAADVIVFSVVQSFVRDLSISDKSKLPHLLRWVDYIQNKEDFGKLFDKIFLEKIQIVPYFVIPEKKPGDFKVKKSVQEPNDPINSSSDSKAIVDVDSQRKKVEGSNPATSGKKKLAENEAEKKKPPEKEVEKKDEEVSISLLKIQIGRIQKAWKHPSADSLLVEEIDVGEAKCRQVVSGLAKFCNPDQLTNRRVVLITNVKPGKLRDVMSEGLVLCASNQDHSIVEPLIAPEEAIIGECVTFFGHNGKPEDVLNPKKKQLDKITPHLFTDDKGVATFKSIPFMTSVGPCTSSIPNASVK